MGLYSVKNIWYQTLNAFLVVCQSKFLYQQVLKFYNIVPNLCTCDHVPKGCFSRQTLYPILLYRPPHLLLLCSDINVGLFHSG